MAETAFDPVRWRRAGVVASAGLAALPSFGGATLRLWAEQRQRLRGRRRQERDWAFAVQVLAEPDPRRAARRSRDDRRLAGHELQIAAACQGPCPRRVAGGERERGDHRALFLLPVGRVDRRAGGHLGAFDLLPLGCAGRYGTGGDRRALQLLPVEGDR